MAQKTMNDLTVTSVPTTSHSACSPHSSSFCALWGHCLSSNTSCGPASRPLHWLCSPPDTAQLTPPLPRPNSASPSYLLPPQLFFIGPAGCSLYKVRCLFLCLLPRPWGDSSVWAGLCLFRPPHSPVPRWCLAYGKCVHGIFAE